MSEDKAQINSKWFYGKDLPMPVAGGDTANPAWGGSTVGTYGTSNGTLFKPDIDIVDDANQILYDCRVW